VADAGEPTEWSGAGPASAARIRELAGVGPFGPAGRIALAMLYAMRWTHRGLHSVPLAQGGTLYLSRRTLESDFETLREIFLPRKNPYTASYTHATVLDVGAHKGYYGAFALLGGASRVFSYEPASDNYKLLDRAAASFRRAGRQWETRRAAVGAAAGLGVLQVSAESWTHSLHAALPETGSARAVSSEVVELVTGAEVLAEAADAADGGRLIVKIDAEGAECEICLETDTQAWAAVDEVFIETHESAPCDSAMLAGRLKAAGLVTTGANGSVVHLVRRRP
jgi:FkbM family methyltransferase